MTARCSEMAQEVKTLEMLEHTGPKERTDSCMLFSDTHTPWPVHTHTYGE